MSWSGPLAKPEGDDAVKSFATSSKLLSGIAGVWVPADGSSVAPAWGDDSAPGAAELIADSSVIGEGSPSADDGEAASPAAVVGGAGAGGSLSSAVRIPAISSFRGSDSRTRRYQARAVS